MALKIRSDILSQPTHQGLNISREDALACVPESLYMFIRPKLGGQYLLENGLNDSDDNDKKDDSDFVNGEDNEAESAEDYGDDEQDSTDSEEEERNQSNQREKRNQENQVETRVLSIAQDLVYSVSGGRMWTPKHISLGSSLHQATRSKETGANVS